jgi:hypothetical protein
MFVVYGWCRWGAAQIGFSPLIQLGQTSLMVYWIHIEFVYNRLILLPSHGNSIGRAVFGLLYITVFMLVLSMIRTRLKGHGSEILGRFRAAALPVTRSPLPDGLVASREASSGQRGTENGLRSGYFGPCIWI